MDEKKQSFWTTIPGMLTGVAAIITAVGGLYVALHQNPQPQQTAPETTRDIHKPSPDQVPTTIPQTDYSPSDPVGASYEAECREEKEGKTITMIIQLTSVHQARWKSTDVTSWYESSSVEALSPHRYQLSTNVPMQQLWDLEFSDDYRSVKGTFRTFLPDPRPARWWNFVVTGSRVE